jgi:hypothetical protein
MATRNGLQERIRAALRTDAEFYRGLAELQAADSHLRSLADHYVAKHDAAPHGDSYPAVEELATVAPSRSPVEVRLTAELARQVDESRSLSYRLRRCRHWLIAASVTLAIAAAGAGVLSYLEITRN